MKRAAARIVFVALFLLVTVLTLTPNPDDASPGFALTRFIAALLFGDGAAGDKVAHFLAYAALGASAAAAGVAVGGRFLFTALALASYGALLEVLQGLGGVRSAEVLDGAANAAGALAGVAAAVLLLRAVAQRAAA